MKTVLSFVVCLLVVISAEIVDYSGYRLVRATPDTHEQLMSLAQYLHQRSAQGDVDVWKLPRAIRNDATFSVSGDALKTTSYWLRRRSIRYQVDRRDLGRLATESIENEIERQRYARSQVTSVGPDLDVYNDHDTINEYLQLISDSCDICEVINIGQSYEGRDMDVIKIGNFGNNKKAIWIDAGIHAREWIAPATALNIIDNIVEGYNSNEPDATWLLTNYVWFILPSANPDGYEYSRTTDRLWRKTRRPNRRGCVGTDPNRNWNFHWAEEGTSENPCSEIFPGPNPFSEVETQNMRNFLIRRKNLFEVYLSLHSYGQYWLYPWGFDSSLPDDWEQLDGVGRRAVTKIYDVHGKNYTLGSSTNVLYAAAGASDDWAKGIAGIKYAYTVELRDVGEFGFMLPSSQIQPTAEEIWAAIVEMSRAIKDTET